MSDPKEDNGSSKGQADKRSYKRSYINMWHMVSQHVLSDVVSKVGNELLDGTNDGVDAETRREDHNPRKHGRSFYRDDVVKLIREAVNEILTMPIQDDSSDTQSVTSDIISDQELSKAEGKVNNSLNSAKILKNLDITEDGKMLDQEMKDPKEERELPLTMNKPKTQMSKNWSKLKKLILPRISIKGLEKARKFNPREPQLIPATPTRTKKSGPLGYQSRD
ncbi:hypothetical protein BC332_12790 [Capsicum chinense]|nr:hypothetical protein BC332_12790 [Capsicum chinense]